MLLIDRDSFLWSYLQPEIRALVTDGEILIDFAEIAKVNAPLTDYSFLVFPFSKAYEGFLKKLFLDLGIIRHEDYYGDEIRIGRILNPHYQKELGNAFSQMCTHSPERKNIAARLWEVWKTARNLVFHFFPHNFRKLTYEDARALIKEIIGAMELSVLGCDLPTKKKLS